MDKRLHITHLRKSLTFKSIVELIVIKHDVLNGFFLNYNINALLLKIISTTRIV